MTLDAKDPIPQPPKPLFADVDDVMSALAGMLPEIIKFYDPFTGGRVTHVPRGAHKKFTKLTKVLALSLRPLLLLDELENERISWARFNYGRIEAMMRTNLAASGLRVDWKEDSFVPLLRMTEKYVNPFGKATQRLQAYVEAVGSLQWLAETVIAHSDRELMERVSKAWAGSPDARKWFAFCEQLDRSAKRWSMDPPRRFTDALIDRLLHQYEASAKAVEMRLKVVAAFLKGINGSPTPWNDVEHQSLNNLLQIVSAHDPMRQMASLINRNVRNSLAHGVPERNRRERCVIFHDRDVPVRWSFEELYAHARDITLCALALCTLEPRIQLKTLQNLVFPIWREIEAEESARSTVVPQKDLLFSPVGS